MLIFLKRYFLQNLKRSIRSRLIVLAHWLILAHSCIRIWFLLFAGEDNQIIVFLYTLLFVNYRYLRITKLCKFENCYHLRLNFQFTREKRQWVLGEISIAIIIVISAEISLLIRDCWENHDLTWNKRKHYNAV